MEEIMNTTMTRISMTRLAPMMLMTLLTFGLFFMNLRESSSVAIATQPLSEIVMVTTVGSDSGACGIFVGLATGVIAAGVAGATVGLGAAVAISVGLHLSAALCLS